MVVFFQPHATISSSLSNFLSSSSSFSSSFFYYLQRNYFARLINADAPFCVCECVRISFGDGFAVSCSGGRIGCHGPGGRRKSN